MESRERVRGKLSKSHRRIWIMMTPYMSRERTRRAMTVCSSTSSER